MKSIFVCVYVHQALVDEDDTLNRHTWIILWPMVQKATGSRVEAISFKPNWIGDMSDINQKVTQKTSSRVKPKKAKPTIGDYLRKAKTQPSPRVVVAPSHVETPRTGLTASVSMQPVMVTTRTGPLQLEWDSRRDRSWVELSERVQARTRAIAAISALPWTDSAIDRMLAAAEGKTPQVPTANPEPFQRELGALLEILRTKGIRRLVTAEEYSILKQIMSQEERTTYAALGYPEQIEVFGTVCANLEEARTAYQLSFGRKLLTELRRTAQQQLATAQAAYEAAQQRIEGDLAPKLAAVYQRYPALRPASTSIRAFLETEESSRAVPSAPVEDRSIGLTTFFSPETVTTTTTTTT